MDKYALDLHHYRRWEMLIDLENNVVRCLNRIDMAVNCYLRTNTTCLGRTAVRRTHGFELASYCLDIHREGSHQESVEAVAL